MATLFLGNVMIIVLTINELRCFYECRVKVLQETHWRQEAGRLDRIKPHNLPQRPLAHLRYARKCNAFVGVDPFQENPHCCATQANLLI